MDASPVALILLFLNLAITIFLLFEAIRISLRRNFHLLFIFYLSSWIVWTVAVITVRAAIYPPGSLAEPPLFPAPAQVVFGYHFLLLFLGSRRSIIHLPILLIGYASIPFFLGVALVNQNLVEALVLGLPFELFTTMGTLSLIPVLFQTFFALVPVVALYKYSGSMHSPAMRAQALYLLAGFAIVLVSRTLHSILVLDPSANLILVPVGMGIMLLGLRKHGFVIVTPVAEGEPRTPTRFELRPGSCYLALEADPSTSFFTFSQMVKQGYAGLCVTRVIPDTIRGAYQLKSTPILWLINSSAGTTIHPRDLHGLFLTVQRFIQGAQRAIIILDGVEYLVSVNGFRPVLLLIKKLNKIVSEKQAILILALVPGSLNETDEAALRSMCERLYDKRLPPL